MLDLQSLPAEHEPGHGHVDPRRVPKVAAGRAQPRSRTRARASRGTVSEPPGVGQILGMLQPSALDLADPDVGMLPREDLLAHPALAEALDEVLEGCCRINLGERAGGGPVRLVVDGGFLWYPEVWDAEKGAKPTAAGDVGASKVVLRQIPATVRGFEDGGHLWPRPGGHGEVGCHRGLSARQTIVWPNGRERLDRERYRASQARLESSSRLSHRRFMIPSRMPSPSYTVPWRW